ncbi:hypothetical protein ACFQU9_44545 [Actinomadura namibiensis]|uniref:Uncharacterized protein n=1 Tax=Actinomadura namibiensis TaxID=182080 RepID=A0A7W3QSC4_ACTNM|nr:hypothetical protein [Actinomadura namibiensis]MBA8957685.1 hypothetical protein [Actinomadura namibiensis]
MPVSSACAELTGTKDEVHPAWDLLPCHQAAEHLGDIAQIDLEAQPTTNGRWVVLIRPGV